MIRYANNLILARMLAQAYHSTLVELFVWVTCMLHEVVVTNAYRPGDPGVHGQCRALDIRSWIYGNPQAVVDKINSEWVYDSSRPEMKVAILHDVGSGMHIHLQAHDATKRLDDASAH